MIELREYMKGWKPESNLKNTAIAMICIIFDETASNEERDTAASTLAEAVLPELLDKACRYEGLLD